MLYSHKSKPIVYRTFRVFIYRTNIVMKAINVVIYDVGNQEIVEADFEEDTTI